MPPLSNPAPPPFSLRPAGPPDHGFLFRLYADTRADELARTGWSLAQREDFLRSQFQARRADYARRFPDAEELIVLVDGRDAGVWTIHRGASELRLVNIELSPDYRNKGIGSALIRDLLAEGSRLGLPATLSVQDSNQGAQRIYRRLGFTVDKRSQGYLAMRALPKRR